MRIGVIFAMYNCEGYVDRCLEPWINLRDNTEEHEFILTAVSGRFKYFNIPDRNSKTKHKIVDNNLDFSVLLYGDNPLDENSNRNICLDYLKKQECDYIFAIDGDEFYTEQQINGIIRYALDNQSTSVFSVYFKNYTLEIPYFQVAWSKPVLYKFNTEYGSIDSFYFDQDFNYSDGIHNAFDVIRNQIPKYIAFVEHYSWLSDEYTKEKVEYQNNRFPGNPIYDKGRCQFEWHNNGLVFSDSFYAKIETEIPILYTHPTSIVTNSVHIHYTRSNNRILISSEIPMEKCKVHIKELNGTLISIWDTNIEPDFYVWYSPNMTEEKIKSLDGYTVEIYLNDILIHVEKLHIKMGIK